MYKLKSKEEEVTCPVTFPISGRTDTRKAEICDGGEGIMFIIYYVLALYIYLLKDLVLTTTLSGLSSGLPEKLGN